MTKATLKVLGKLYEAEGETVKEALLNLNPATSRVAGTLTISKGELSKTIIIQSRTMSQIYGKMMSRMFKERAINGIVTRFDSKLFE